MHRCLARLDRSLILSTVRPVCRTGTETFARQQICSLRTSNSRQCTVTIPTYKPAQLKRRTKFRAACCLCSTERLAEFYRESYAAVLQRASQVPRRSSTTMTAFTEVGNSVMDVLRVPMFESNYGWILRDRESGKVATVDPGAPEAIQKALEEKAWKLDYILNTHHHFDHVGGNKHLKEAYGCEIVGPRADASRIPGMDTGVGEGDVVAVGGLKFQVLDTPGHTSGHITFWQEEAGALFPGDTLFALGCGRLFEGTPEQMWESLSKLMKLPPTTAVFCAHEYTQANARWAVALNPQNPALAQRKQRIDEMRAKGEPTIPSVLGDEFETNPFLCPDSVTLRVELGVLADAPDAVAFGAIRRHKDGF